MIGLVPRLVLVFLCAFFPCAGVNAQSPDKAPATPASPALTSAEFSKQLHSIAEDTAGITGIAIRDLKTGEEFSVRGDRKFSQAGLSKLHVLAALMRESTAGRIDLASSHTLAANEKLPGGILQRLGEGTVTMSLRDYATLMIVIDDNTAASILFARLGLPAVKDTLNALGAQDVHFAGLTTNPKNPEDNTASPRGILRCLVALHDGPVLDPAARKEFFDMLSTPRQGALRAGIPGHVQVASKSGLRGSLRNTAAIVFLKHHPYAITIMIQPPHRDDPVSGNDSSSVITDVSKLAYRYFSRLEPAEPEPPAKLPPARP